MTVEEIMAAGDRERQLLREAREELRCASERGMQARLEPKEAEALHRYLLDVERERDEAKAKAAARKGAR